MSRVGSCYIVAREDLPEQLDAVALRLTAASGHRSQVRDMVGRATAGELRRIVLELLDPAVDQCLEQTRRSSFQLLAAAAASMTASARRPDQPYRDT